MYHWDFAWVWTYREQLARAFLVTIELNSLVVLLGTFGGVLLGSISLSTSRAVRVSVRVYVDIFRTLPVLVLLVWVFFCVPVLLGGLRISSFICAVMVLSLNLSSFVAEIVRGGIEAVPRHQIESARAAGLSRVQTARFVTLPLALRIMVPPMVGQYINTIKLSVLASVIAVPELLQRTEDIISQVYRPLEFYTVLAALFLLLLLPGTLWSRKLENRDSIESRARS